MAQRRSKEDMLPFNSIEYSARNKVFAIHLRPSNNHPVGNYILNFSSRLSLPFDIQTHLKYYPPVKLGD